MNLSQQELKNWNQFLTRVNDDLDPEESEAWGTKLKLVDISPNQITIGGINHFFSNWIKEHYYSFLRNRLIDCFEKKENEEIFRFNIHSNTETKENSKSVNTFVNSSKSSNKHSDGLNPNYTFDNFVNGENSEIAYAAAEAVGEKITDSKYNPLFICGDVGLGKTHLIHGIGLKAREKKADLKIRYASSKEFTNEVINGIRFGGIHEVRNKYRYVDLLLIDDIHFIEKKEATQEEFFHTFNDLIQNNKQIVITADRYPREIKNLEERLVNRFNSGMVARINPPNLETREAIIRNKVEDTGLPIDDKTINFIAASVKTNVRDIEGILVNIEANWSLLGQDISLETVKRILKEVLNIENNPKTVDNIIKLVADKLQVKTGDIKSNKRDSEISRARQIAMFTAKEVTNLSYPVIGKHFGGKNHTTVIHACKKTKERISEDAELRQVVTSIIRDLSN